MPYRIEHYGEGMYIGDCAVEDVHVFRAFLIRFVHALLYLAPIPIVDSRKTLKELARARSNIGRTPLWKKSTVWKHEFRRLSSVRALYVPPAGTGSCGADTVMLQ